MKGLIVAGIGTDVGKTVASAVVCEALSADYWKPIASGLAVGPGDDEAVSSLLGGAESRIHPCAYAFTQPLSPHVAAALDGCQIDLAKCELPSSSAPVVVELAGGVLVPLDNEHTNLDLVSRLGLPVLLVSKHYLGSINHTLLSLEALRSRGIPVLGVLFNGEELPDSERIIERMGQVAALGRIPNLPCVDREAVVRVASGLRESIGAAIRAVR